MDINQILSDAGYWTIHNGIKIIVVLILTLVLIKVVQLLLNRISLGFTKRKEEDEYTERADKLNSVVRHLLNFIIIIVAIVIILKIAGVNVNGIIQWVVTKGLKIFLILVGVLVAIKAIQIFSGRFSDTLSKQKKVDAEYLKRAETLSSVIQHLLDVIVLLVAIMMILNEIGVEIGPILAAAGIVGLAVGFGAQSLVKDVINGFFLLLQDQIRVGDVVQVGDHGGLVESINLKNTALRDLAGNVHYIPNGNIDIVTNMTKGFSRYVFEIGVAYREDVDEVINVIKLVDEDLRKQFTDQIVKFQETLDESK